MCYYSFSMQLTIKAGEELTDKEFDQINKVSLREFQVGLTSVKKLEGRILFLLLENQSILAQGQLIPIAPVAFNDGYYSLLGIGGIIAHEKGKGFGKQIMTAVKSYLVSRNKTGVGFCMPKNKVFYEKCGFMINTDSTERFVYRENGKKIALLNRYLS